MDVKAKDRARLTIRLKPGDHMAIKRMALAKGLSINKIIDILITKSIPEKYYIDPYADDQA